MAVAAVGVNFRDVVAALGMYPGQAPALGAEGAGVVIETGPEVAGVAVGDAVMGLMAGTGRPKRPPLCGWSGPGECRAAPDDRGRRLCDRLGR